MTHSLLDAVRSGDSLELEPGEIHLGIVDTVNVGEII